jgi:flagellar hook-associated protein 1 FlgK
MSLTSSLNTAVSGLQANQTLMRVASSNIANANTEGYTKKTGELSAIILGGVGAGVNVDDIRRTVDNFLIKEANNQSSTVAKADAMTEFYSRLQDLFGTPEANSSIAGQLNELRTAFEELSVDPNLSVTQFTTVTAAKELTDSLNNLAVTLQEMRQEVDRQINDAVDIVNEQLTRLDKLNADIVRNKVIGSPTGDLEDQRDVALQLIAEQIDIKWFTKANGAVM